MRAIAVSILLVSSALAGEAPALVVAGPPGETKSLQASDLRKLAVREVTVTEPHGKQAAAPTSWWHSSAMASRSARRSARSASWCRPTSTAAAGCGRS